MSTNIPENAYAIVLEEVMGSDDAPAQQITIVCPKPEDEDQPITRGHLLMIGLSMKLNEPDWANDLIAKTTNVLSQLRDAATSTDDLSKID